MSETTLKILLWGVVLLILFLVWAIPSFILWLLEQFHRCPQCGHRRGRVVSERITRGATLATSVKKRKECRCAHCGKTFIIYEDMGRRYGRFHSSGSGHHGHGGGGSSSGSSSYGGGSFGGGGAGTRW